MIRGLLAIYSLALAMAMTSAQDTWTVASQDIDPDNYYGVTMANGMIGLVSSAKPLTIGSVVLNGVYDNYQRGRVSNILKGFSHLNMTLDVNGRRVETAQVTDYAQSLNMRTATLITRFEVAGVRVTHEMMALRHLPYTALIRITLENGDKSSTVTPAAVIEAPPHLADVRNYYAEIDRPHVRIPLLTSVASSPTSTQQVAASVSFLFPERHGSEPDIVHEDWDYNRHLAKFTRTLAPGETYTFSIVGSTCATAHYTDPHNEAERLTIFARLEGADKLISRHIQAWQELWDSGDIVITGDTQVQRDVRFALYHLYSFARAGSGLSISPMGLSGLGYNGHVFWDTELWMYPPLLMLQPEIARSLLDYRFERLDAAKQNALAHGFRGAMFPWESADDGSEDTPVWALTGPFQHHITGCVAWAHWKYFEVTQDMSWLRDRGWPVLEAAADFWASRVERNGPGHYDITNVIGANEWQENIDNNAFTNGIAITTLRYATKAAELMRIPADPDWVHVAENIPLLQFEDGTTKENATYDGVDIKQADVNLLAYPLEFITDRDQIAKDLEYYAPRMSDEGPAMGPAILSILYNMTGQVAKAEELFYASYQPNRVPPFGVISETAGGTNPYFATGAGGMLQAALSGFGGLRIHDSGVVQVPSEIPAGWEQLRIIGVGDDAKTYVVE